MISLGPHGQANDTAGTPHAIASAMPTPNPSKTELDTKKEIQKENVSYEHAGYQIRVHFNGEKTLIQCIQNLTERKIAG